jgi:hypothetical protein
VAHHAFGEFGERGHRQIHQSALDEIEDLLERNHQLDRLIVLSRELTESLYGPLFLDLISFLH